MLSLYLQMGISESSECSNWDKGDDNIWHILFECLIFNKLWYETQFIHAIRM